MVRLSVCVGLLLVMGLVVGPSLTQVEPASTPTPIPAVFEPAALSGLVCAQRCLTETINVRLAPLNRPPILSLDLLLVMDITGSMSSVLNTVKASAADIVNTLRSRVPDMRIAAVTYADYPGLHGDSLDEAYTLVSDFTDNLDPFQTQLREVELGSGGDSAESLLRALDESTRLNWRSDALRVLVVFTDAAPHDPDPGADASYRTGDDLNSVAVIEGLQDETIIVIGVQAGFSGDAEDFLREVAGATDGDYFRLANADEIPFNVVRLVGAELDEATLSFVAHPDNGGFSQTPPNFLYPEQGGIFPVTASICPAEWGMPDGSYQFDLALRQGSNDYGSVPVALDYYARCADFVVRDTPDDDACNSDILFWDSPDIVVRTQADGVMTTQPHIPGQLAYIYVSLSNRGPLADSGTLVLYSSAVAGSWESVGEMPVHLEAGQSVQVGPFELLTTGEMLSLRAVIDSVEDPVMNLENPACDDNVALQERVYLSLDNPTLGSINQVGGELRLNLAHSVEAHFDLSTLNGSLVVEDADTEDILPAGEVTIRAATANTAPGTIPVRLGEEARGWMIYYTPDHSRLLRLQNPAAASRVETGASALDRDAILVAGVLIVLAIGLIVVSLRRPVSRDGEKTS